MASYTGPSTSAPSSQRRPATPATSASVMAEWASTGEDIPESCGSIIIVCPQGFSPKSQWRTLASASAKLVSPVSSRYSIACVTKAVARLLEHHMKGMPLPKALPRPRSAVSFSPWRIMEANSAETALSASAAMI